MTERDDITSDCYVTWWWCKNCNCYHTGVSCPHKDEGEHMTDKLDRIIEILERIERR